MKTPRLRVLTDFPGAAADALRVADGVIRFVAPLGDSPRSMWWHFAVHSSGETLVPCVWDRTHEVLGYGGLDAVVPVYHDGERWRRVPARSCRYDPGAQTFIFTLPCRRGRTEVAYCYPYSFERVEGLLAEMVASHGAIVRTVALSAAGRPFQLLECGDGPVQVWVTARHHAGEVSGAHVLEGLVREVVRTPALLRAAAFHIAPAMDVDGVAEGMYGKDRTPRDYNRDYVSKPARPEIAALQAEARRLGADVFLDLHAPAPGDGSFLVPVTETLVDDAYWAEAWRVGRALEALAPASCPVRVADWPRGSLNWYGENLQQTSTEYFQAAHGALAFTLETTYHRSWNGRLVDQAGWYGLGKAMARALGTHLGVRPEPDLTGIPQGPQRTVPRFARWLCVHVPDSAVLSETPRSLAVASGGERGSCWMMLRAPVQCEGGRVKLDVRLDGCVEACTVTVKQHDPRRDLPTGAWTSHLVELQRGKRWQEITLPTRWRCVKLMLRVEGLEGRLELRG